MQLGPPVDWGLALLEVTTRYGRASFCEHFQIARRFYTAEGQPHPFTSKNRLVKLVKHFSKFKTIYFFVAGYYSLGSGGDY